MSKDARRAEPAHSFDVHASTDGPFASFRSPHFVECLPGAAGDSASAGIPTRGLHFWQRNRFFLRMMFAYRACLDRRILQAIWCLQPEATIGAVAESLHQRGRGNDVRMSEVAAAINRLARDSLVQITSAPSNDGSGEVKSLIVPTEMGRRRLGMSAGHEPSRVSTTRQCDHPRG